MAKSGLPEVWDVPQVFRDRLGEQAGRQRAMFADGHLLLVLHEPPKPDEDRRRGVYFWRQPDGTWSSSGQFSGANAVARHLADYADAIERFDQLNEAAQTADEYFAVIEGLGPLHRAARNLHAVLQEARKLVPTDRDIINFRDLAYEVERTAELLYDVVKNSLDFAVAKRAEEQAQASHRMAVSAHRLNVLAAFFFPVVTLAALFSTNLKSTIDDFVQPPVVTLAALFSTNLKSTIDDFVQPPFAWLLVMSVGLLAGLLLMKVINQRSSPHGGRESPSSRVGPS